jgi:hypothetical protein
MFSFIENGLIYFSLTEGRTIGNEIHLSGIRRKQMKQTEEYAMRRWRLSV